MTEFDTAFLRTLAPRYKPILALLAEGRSNKDIARLTTLKPHTVEEYVSELLEMTGAESRTQLALRFASAFHVTS